MGQERTYKFVVKAGPNPGEVYTLQKDIIIIGREPTKSDWWINFTVVSQRHAKVTRVGEAFQIEDLGSSNGTYVNGKKIASAQILKSGDEVGLGKSVVFSYVIESTLLPTDATLVDAPAPKFDSGAPTANFEKAFQSTGSEASRTAESSARKSFGETLAGSLKESGLFIRPESIVDKPNEQYSVSLMISYSRKDKEFIQRLHTGLIKQGIAADNIWVDWEGIPLSADWREEITRGIQKSDVFLFVISPDSLSSPVCAEEVEIAVKNNKRIVAVLHREPEKGNPMPDVIGATNWVYLRASDDFKAVIPQLVETLNTDLGWVRQHTRILERAIEWNGAKRNKAYLLRGADLEEAENWLSTGATQTQKPTPLQIEYIQLSRKDSKRRQRVTLVGVSTALIVSLGLAIIAWGASINATEQKKIALQRGRASKSQAVAAISNQQLDNDPQLALSLALHSIQGTQQDDVVLPASVSALYKAMDVPNVVHTLRAHTGTINQVEVCAGKNISITAGNEGKAIVWAYFKDEVITIFAGHGNNPVLSVAISPDCARAASVDAAGHGFIWDVETGNVIGEMPNGMENSNSVSYNHDGSLVAAINANGGVTISDGFTGGFKSGPYNFDGGITDLKFFSEEDLLVLGDLDGIIRIFNIKTKMIERELVKWSFRPIEDLDVSSTGGYIGAPAYPNPQLGAEPLVSVYNFYGDSDQSSLSSFNGGVLSVNFSQDGRKIFTTGADIRVWSANGVLLQAFAGHSGGITDLAEIDNEYLITVGVDQSAILWRQKSGVAKFPDNEKLSDDFFQASVRPTADFTGTWPNITIVAGLDRDVLIYDVSTGAKDVVPIFSEHDDAVNSVHFSTDQSQVISASYGDVFVWDRITGLEQHHFSFDGDVIDAVLSPTGDWAGIVAEDEGLLIWDVNNNTLVTRLAGEFKSFSALDISANGSMLIAAGVNNESGNQAVIWKTSNWEVISTLAHKALINDVAFSPNGEWVATASDDYTAALWFPTSGERRFTLSGHSGPVELIKFNKDSSQLVSGSSDNSIKAWDITTGLELFSYYHFLGFDKGVVGVGFDDSGNYMMGVDEQTNFNIISIGYDELIKIAGSYSVRDLTPEECYQYLGIGWDEQALNPCKIDLVDVTK